MDENQANDDAEDTMAEILNLLKPAPFKVEKKGDPEQLHMDVEKYVDNFNEFLTTTEVDGEHT